MDIENMLAQANNEDDLLTLTGMYKEYFLDYASYVILERAVPHLNDGFKPVQRRLLHALKQMDDGRFHKVANVIGQTMQYHPHGDAAIGDALINMGQKDLLIDCQGNWGDVRTGDSAAAPRYIEARLTKFALEVIFNPQTTEWQMSYDGRNREPITLPVKFPMVLTSGVDGIAVGLATKILPHNFIELIKASIDILRDKKFKIYPDFQTGGFLDVSDYNDGIRGGKLKNRARVEIKDKNTLAITELPYGVTTSSLIDSIIKAVDKGKIKVKKVYDNTAKNVEIILELAPGVSPDVTVDALYAFTSCENSISPNCCIVVDNKPKFLGVSEILKISTLQTKDLLRQELEIKRGELQEKWHMASLEKIFIENRIYRDIEECETWEEVISSIDTGLKKFVGTPSDPAQPNDGRIQLVRDITEDDIVRLTEIKIKRISKYNSFKADEQIKGLEEDLKQVNHDLEHLTEFAIAYFERLLAKYGKGKDRKTVLTSIDSVEVQNVVANNAKLYVNYKDGFVGMGMKKDEFVCECSDIDDVIAFTKDGKFKVVRIADKVFIGKNIIHVDVWKKGDERTTYNLIYVDGDKGVTYAKRFNVKSITRDKEYDLTTGAKGSKVLHFGAYPNGESELISIQLSPGCSAKKKVFNFDLADLAIKGRGSRGNTVTKYPVRKVSLVEVGKSTLGAIMIWIDEVSGRLNTEERGQFVGAFDTGTKILNINKDGSYELNDLDMAKKYDMSTILHIGMHTDDQVISALHYEGDKGWTMVKRFAIEAYKNGQKYSFISESSGSKLYFASVHPNPIVVIKHREGKETVSKTLSLAELIDPKGWKAIGNKVGEFKVTSVKDESPVIEEKEPPAPDQEDQAGTPDLFSNQTPPDIKNDDQDGNNGIKPGDIIELDF